MNEHLKKGKSICLSVCVCERERQVESVCVNVCVLLITVRLIAPDFPVFNITQIP